MDHLNGPPDLAQRVHLPEFPVILTGMVGELTVRLTVGDPYGTRTRVFAVKGRRPRPLDEGAV